MPASAADSGSVPPGQRRWTCPDCRNAVLVPIARLDPMACDDCLAKKQRELARGSGAGLTTSQPHLRSFVSSTALICGLGGLVIGGIIGLILGFTVARMIQPSAVADPRSGPFVAPKSEVSTTATSEEQSSKSGQKWVKPYKRADGTTVEGHWRPLNKKEREQEDRK